MSNRTVQQILEDMFSVAETGVDSEVYKSKKFEELFKELAGVTEGSILFNWHPAEEAYDGDGSPEAISAGIELANLEEQWLREIGKDKVAERWHSATERVKGWME